jgi:cytochrome c oxidase subunit 1
MTGRFLDEGLARLQFILMLIGMNMAFMPMHVLGLRGMPRRIATYVPDQGWEAWNLISTVGAFLIATAMLVFAINLVKSLRGPIVAGDDPWEGATLEWMTSSPPPKENFHQLPEIQSESPAADLRMRRTGIATVRG